MSIAQTVKETIKHTSYVNVSADFACYCDKEIVKNHNGVLLREASAEDGIRSTFRNPWGWVYGFSDGSQLAVVYNGEPVILSEGGSINYPQQQQEESARRQQKWLDSLPADSLVIYQGDKAFLTKGRAWWISHALQLPDDRISVARIHAHDKDGQLYILELTEEMLSEYGLVPGALEFPNVVDAPRPLTNRIDRPTSQKTYQKLMDDLQNERGIHSPE